jgi:hypothetical protein
MKDIPVVQATIGGRCLAAREGTGFKKQAFLEALLAEGVDIDRKTLWRYETGQRDKDIPAVFIAAVAKITREDPAYLVSGVSSSAHAKLKVIEGVVSADGDELAEIAGILFPPSGGDPPEEDRGEEEGLGWSSGRPREGGQFPDPALPS